LSTQYLQENVIVFATGVASAGTGNAVLFTLYPPHVAGMNAKKKHAPVSPNEVVVHAADVGSIDCSKLNIHLKNRGPAQIVSKVHGMKANT